MNGRSEAMVLDHTCPINSTGATNAAPPHVLATLLTWKTGEIYDGLYTICL